MKAIAAAVPDVKHYFSHVEFSNECKINNEIISFTTRRPYIFSRGNIIIELYEYNCHVKLGTLIIFDMWSSPCGPTYVYFRNKDKYISSGGMPVSELIDIDEIINSRDILAALSAAADNILIKIEKR